MVVDDEGPAVEDELVLPAHLVHIGDVAVGVFGSGRHHALALAVPAAEVGRAVRDDDELSPPGRLGGDGALGTPHVLADRDPHLDPCHLEQREGGGAGGEVALLVEDGVVRKEALLIDPLHLPAGAERRGVVEIALGIDEADDGGAASCAGGHLVERSPVGGDKPGLQHEVLGRVAGDGQLREDDDVAPRCFGIVVGGEDPLHVAVEVADHGVQLGEPDPDSCHPVSVRD